MANYDVIEEVKKIAEMSLINWEEAPIIQMARSISNCALISGHYSIWRKVFESEQMVLDEIDRAYFTKGLFKT